MLFYIKNILLQKSLGNLLDLAGFIIVAQELLYLDNGYLPFSLIAGSGLYYPGPGTPLVRTIKSFSSLGLIVYLVSLKVDPRSYFPGA